MSANIILARESCDQFQTSMLRAKYTSTTPVRGPAKTHRKEKTYRFCNLGEYE